MTEHYVTLFNHLFLPQGLALHQSMERHLGDYILWILCVDDQTYDVIDELKLANVIPLKLSLLETDELKAVKSTRTVGEYCWTLTPFAPRFVFEADERVKRVTYLDADLWFLKSPREFFEELKTSQKQVLITEHAYAPEYDQSAVSGKYCVQFIVFTRHGGEIVRRDWEQRCIDWCFARAEGGKFGDQKYLDDWPINHELSVHVLRDNKLTLAPWNATRYPYGTAVFYHFHGLRIISKKLIQIGPYVLPKALIKYVYLLYFEDLRRSLLMLEIIGYQYIYQASKVQILIQMPRILWRKLFKNNLLSMSVFKIW